MLVETGVLGSGGASVPASVPVSQAVSTPVLSFLHTDGWGTGPHLGFTWRLPVTGQ